MQTLEEIAAGIANDCLGHHDSRLVALTADILAALRAERERLASAVAEHAQKLRSRAQPGDWTIAAAFDDFAAAIRNQP